MEFFLIIAFIIIAVSGIQALFAVPESYKKTNSHSFRDKMWYS